MLISLYQISRRSCVRHFDLLDFHDFSHALKVKLYLAEYPNKKRNKIILYQAIKKHDKMIEDFCQGNWQISYIQLTKI